MQHLPDGLFLVDLSENGAYFVDSRLESGDLLLLVVLSLLQSSYLVLFLLLKHFLVSKELLRASNGDVVDRGQSTGQLLLDRVRIHELRHLLVIVVRRFYAAEALLTDSMQFSCLRVLGSVSGFPFRLEGALSHL